MPDNVTRERTQLLAMYGAEIVYSPGDQGSNGAVAMALEMAEADASYYMPYQYGNQANPRAHYDGTALEILEELDEVDGVRRRPRHGRHADGQRAGASRSTTRRPRKIVAAEPMQGELVQGLRSLDDGFIPPIIDLALLDRKIFVTNRDAVVWTQQAARRGGPVRGRLERRDRRDRRPHRRRDGRGQRRLRRLRRRLEVPRARASTPSRSTRSRPTARSRRRRSGSELAASATPPARGESSVGVQVPVGLRSSRAPSSSSSSSLVLDARERPELVLVLVVVAGEPLERSRISRMPLPTERADLGQPAGAEHDQRDHGDHDQLHRRGTRGKRSPCGGCRP